MTFVDTGAWAAFFVREDPDHEVAVDWMRANVEPLATSDYVLDELLTLLKVRFSVRLALEVGEALWSQEFTKLVFLTPDDLGAAWRLFRSHRDKGWSFTDCTSFTLMKRLRIAQAFALDQHFRQMPGVRRVP